MRRGRSSRTGAASYGESIPMLTWAMRSRAVAERPSFLLRTGQLGSNSATSRSRSAVLDRAPGSEPPRPASGDAARRRLVAQPAQCRSAVAGGSLASSTSERRPRSHGQTRGQRAGARRITGPSQTRRSSGQLDVIEMAADRASRASADSSSDVGHGRLLRPMSVRHESSPVDSRWLPVKDSRSRLAQRASLRRHAGLATIDCRDEWAQLGSNQRPPACEAGALPLSYAPRGAQSSARPLLPSTRPVALGGELAVP